MTAKMSIKGLFRLTLLSLVVFGIIYSCKKDEENKVYDPVINLLSPSSTEITKNVGEDLSISLTASTNSNSSGSLKKITIASNFNQTENVIVLDSAISGKTLALNNYNVPLATSTGDQVITITVSESEGGSASVSITVTLEPSPDPPSIEFKTGNYVNSDTTLPINTQFTVGITAQANDMTNAKITRLYVNRKFAVGGDPDTVAYISYNDLYIDWETNVFSLSTQTDEVWRFRVTDEYGQSAIISFTITTGSAGPDIATYTNIELGSTSGNVNQGIDLSTGETLLLEDLQNNPTEQKKVDLVYFQEDGTYGHTFVAPDHNVASSIYSATIGTWLDANKKKTYISKKPGISVSSYDGIENLQQLVTILVVNGNVGQSEIFSEVQSTPGGFNVGDILAFETHYAGGSDVGLIHITEVNEGATPAESTIKFEYKIEND